MKREVQIAARGAYEFTIPPGLSSTSGWYEISSTSQSALLLCQNVSLAPSLQDKSSLDAGLLVPTFSIDTAEKVFFFTTQVGTLPTRRAFIYVLNREAQLQNFTIELERPSQPPLTMPLAVPGHTLKSLELPLFLGWQVTRVKHSQANSSFGALLVLSDPTASRIQLAVQPQEASCSLAPMSVSTIRQSSSAIALWGGPSIPSASKQNLVIELRSSAGELLDAKKLTLGPGELWYEELDQDRFTYRIAYLSVRCLEDRSNVKPTFLASSISFDANHRASASNWFYSPCWLTLLGMCLIMLGLSNMTPWSLSVS
jgi:hypothetical protein